MALIVEDGTIVANADSYISVADAATYITSVGDTRWDNRTDAQKEIYLRRGMRYIEGLSWKGTTVSGLDQPLQWPRADATDRDDNAIDENVIPQAVIDALCEAASRSTTGFGDLQPDLERGGAVAAESVGSISTAYKRSAPNRVVITTIRDILKGLLKSSSSVDIRRA